MTNSLKYLNKIESDLKNRGEVVVEAEGKRCKLSREGVFTYFADDERVTFDFRKGTVKFTRNEEKEMKNDEDKVVLEGEYDFRIVLYGNVFVDFYSASSEQCKFQIVLRQPQTEFLKQLIDELTLCVKKECIGRNAKKKVCTIKYIDMYTSSGGDKVYLQEYEWDRKGYAIYMHRKDVWKKPIVVEIKFKSLS